MLRRIYLWLTLVALSTGFAQRDVFAINETLARTMNFGNSMETRVEGSGGVYLREDDFDVLKDAGFTAVRLPVKFSAHASKTAPFTIRERIFKRVDWAVEQALQRDMSIIIDLHHFDAIMRVPEDSLEMFLGMWAQIAERYQDAPDTVLFEMLNEPNNDITPFWNDYLAQALAVIRETNPERAVIVGPTGWNNIEDLATLELPEDPNLIVTFHNYAPFEFTHQGASWVAGSGDWLGTTWSGSDEEKTQLRALFDTATDWAAERNKPLFMGEFGAYSAADLDSRALWTTFVRQEAESRGISWAYWEYAAGFGAYNRGKKTWNPELLSALIE